MYNSKNICDNCHENHRINFYLNTQISQYFIKCALLRDVKLKVKSFEVKNEESVYYVLLHKFPFTL